MCRTLFNQLIHWVVYILGLMLVTTPLSEDTSVWIGIVMGGLGGLLLAYGLEALVKDIVQGVPTVDPRGS